MSVSASFHPQPYPLQQITQIQMFKSTSTDVNMSSSLRPGQGTASFVGGQPSQQQQPFQQQQQVKSFPAGQGSGAATGLSSHGKGAKEPVGSEKDPSAIVRLVLEKCFSMACNIEEGHHIMKCYIDKDAKLSGG